MTGKPFDVVNLLENNYGQAGTATSTISPSSPPVATAPLSTSQFQPVPSQLRGVSPLESYSDISSTRSNFSNSHSAPVATMDYTPDGVFSSSLITATLCLVWIIVATGFVALLFWLNRVVKRQRALDSAGNVRSFLTRYDENDVRLLKSSLGGWHVVLGRRLIDRVRYYWTKELPGTDEASTILFDDDDHTLPSHHSEPLQSPGGHEVLSPDGCDTSSCGSLSSDDQTVLPHHNSGRRGQILSLQAISYHEGQDSANPGWQCRPSSNPTGSARSLDQHQIQSFLHAQFPSDKILLSKSLPAGGFSVVYCSRLDGQEEVHSYDRIDFYPSQSDMDRIPDCSQPLFKHDDEIERALT